jgi:DNA repair protein RadC
MTHASHTAFRDALPDFDVPAARPVEHFVNNLENRSDEDLLVMLLSRCLEPREAGALARRLMGVFGAYHKVITASEAALRRVLGVTRDVVAALKLVEASAHRMAKCQVMSREVLSCWKSLLDYCQIRMAHLKTEQFRTLYLDRRNVLIADEVAQNGTVDHVPVYPREIMKRALEVNASAIILVHNHPSGDPQPSEDDITMTESIRSAADVMGITIHDHLIIGSEGSFSFQSHGLL